jgi:hypothetical protein
MKKSLFVGLFIFAATTAVFAEAGDTTFVQTFTFADGSQTRQDTFMFPDGSKTYCKVLMYYTLKCDPNNADGNYPCGEWDYDVFTDVLKPTGQVDGNNNPVYDIWRIGTYITPYGINLSLGDGWTWVYDVTDFLPLLKNAVILRDNNGQELLDLKFAFIEGTPVRDVIDIKKVWHSLGYSEAGYWEGYPLKSFDNIIKDTTFTLNTNEKGVSLKTTITGHMMNGNNAAAEFSANVHKVKANGQIIKQWQILQSCADNPLYPQGGTWIHDRAGWCPGMKATTQNTELSQYIQNSSINFDYDVQSDVNGVYRFYSYLTTYGNINQTDDTEAEIIISPTDDKLQTRFNPSCITPKIVIKNIGSNSLKTAEIKYGFTNSSNIYSYNWEGNIEFLHTDTVLLPIIDWNSVETTKAEFFFEIINPNGKTDATPYNNRLTAVCSKPVIFKYNDIRFIFKTNKKPKETTWKLTDAYGKVLYKNEENMTASTEYATDMALKDGSYQLYIFDTGGNGFSYWNNNDGAGKAVLQYFDKTSETYKNLHSFKGDFGDFVQLEFAINKFSTPYPKIQLTEGKELGFYPNPAKNELNVDLLSIDGNNLVAEIYDFQGKKLFEQAVSPLAYNSIPIGTLTNGVYFISVKEDKKQMGRGKFIVAK